MDQIIIHVDMDAFFAAVEIRDDPSLRGKPLIIGSLPNERGVVATASYEARRYGVHSAMNIKEAYRLCPNGIYMHPHMEKYKAVSGQLHEIWNSYASALEAIAFDEAYLDVKEQAADFAGARRIGYEIKQRTREKLGLSCSVGVAYSKTAAKTASEEKKPDGYFEILTPEDFVALIIDRDVRSLYTVGEKTAEKLRAGGIRTVRDIREKQEQVIRLLGKQGQWITGLACGIDDRRVTPYRPEDAKSIGREVTFQKDTDDYEFLKDVLLLLAVCVDRRAKRVGLHGKGVALKLTYADMKQISRSQTVVSADSAADIYRNAVTMLAEVERRPVRLIGTGIYNLSGEEDRQLGFDDVFAESARAKETELMRLLDGLNERYGLDFAGHLEQIYQMDTLHKTIEYMRKHRRR
ncbi:MAG: DNA polymerase IV [Lachnospiraceae bacterium]|nr:DNA polymerase IV [Lachnospiraceae bacterium]